MFESELRGKAGSTAPFPVTFAPGPKPTGLFLLPNLNVGKGIYLHFTVQIRTHFVLIFQVIPFNFKLMK